MLDSSLHNVVMRRYPERLAERAGKMMNRQLCNFGKHFQSDILVQMRLYVFAYAIGPCWCQTTAICGRIH
jgi:hypothetical protein